MASSIQEKMGLVNGTPSLLEEMKIFKELQDQAGAKKTINSELWHACAGPLVSLPQVGSLVYYFPQGHSEQVAVSTKLAATAHIPNYPNLPSQLMCQVHNITLHAEKDTDEIYAQMTLQPVISEKEVFPVSDFGLKPSKHPTEFFCKTLTASDTSTHGGFSVPRRAAEKLFPPLDYSVQPPTQELVVRDLHDNTWTFRHIYRGQPKRHLLTTGWSVFVGSKRLKAGDSVLFIRDEKSQLMLGVRRANHQQTSLPSSVLSADSMHIGVLAAAAHAAANRSPFTIFYNPRACPSEFVVPLNKYQKAVFGNQVSIGMRFGMMFETEESSKRRYMGTIIGVSDLDPLRWPSSKWRNLQVEWDESGCGEKHNRVSLWEIETPESLFIFPSLASGFKRPLHPGFAGTDWGNLIKRPFSHIAEIGDGNMLYAPAPSLGSDQLVRMLLKSPNVSSVDAFSSGLTACVIKGAPLQEEDRFIQRLPVDKPQIIPLQNNSLKYQSCIDPRQGLDANITSQSSIPDKFQPPNNAGNLLLPRKHKEKQELEPVLEADQMNQSTSTGKCNQDKLVGGVLNPQNFGNPSPFLDQGTSQLHKVSRFAPQYLEPNISNPQQTDVSQFETSNHNDFFSYPLYPPSQCMDVDDWLLRPSTCQSLTGGLNSLMPSFGQEPGGSELNHLRYFSQTDNIGPCSQQGPTVLHSNPLALGDFSEANNKEHSGLYNSLNFEVNNGGSIVTDPSVSGTVFDGFAPLGDACFQNPSDCLVGNFSSNQDIQSQITTASLADSQGFSLQEFPDNSGGTSSSNLDFDDSSLLGKGSWQQVSQPLRTYTKVQKMGAVGRSIDVTRFKNYEELRSAISRMFGLEEILDDSKGSGWKLVYVDYENDVLLVGDDPWEEFVTCVRCIRILSPTEVQQMSEEGLLQ